MLLLLTLVYKYALERVPKRKTETKQKQSFPLCKKFSIFLYKCKKSQKIFFKQQNLMIIDF